MGKKNIKREKVRKRKKKKKKKRVQDKDRPVLRKKNWEVKE